MNQDPLTVYTTIIAYSPGKCRTVIFVGNAIHSMNAPTRLKRKRAPAIISERHRICSLDDNTRITIVALSRAMVCHDFLSARGLAMFFSHYFAQNTGLLEFEGLLGVGARAAEIADRRAGIHRPRARTIAFLRAPLRWILAYPLAALFTDNKVVVVQAAGAVRGREGGLGRGSNRRFLRETRFGAGPPAIGTRRLALRLVDESAPRVSFLGDPNATQPLFVVQSEIRVVDTDSGGNRRWCSRGCSERKCRRRHRRHGPGTGRRRHQRRRHGGRGHRRRGH